MTKSAAKLAPKSSAPAAQGDDFAAMLNGTAARPAAPKKNPSDKTASDAAHSGDTHKATAAKTVARNDRADRRADSTQHDPQNKPASKADAKADDTKTASQKPDDAAHANDDAPQPDASQMALAQTQAQPTPPSTADAGDDADTDIAVAAGGLTAASGAATSNVPAGKSSASQAAAAKSAPKATAAQTPASPADTQAADTQITDKSTDKTADSDKASASANPAKDALKSILHGDKSDAPVQQADAKDAAAPQQAASDALPTPPAPQPAQPATPPVPATQAVTAAAPAQQPQASHGVTAPTTTHLSSQATAQTMPGLAVSIAARSQGGARQFDIRLDPPELGHVEVRLSIDATGKTEAHMTADQPQTLALLQKDSQSLTQALRDAGLDVSQNGLNFSLRGQNQQSGDQQGGAQARTVSMTLTATKTIDAAASSGVYTNTGTGDARLDIHV